MHPWRTRRFPDVGRFLFRHVHYLHHKSTNPSPWSGIAMHPVEGLLYESAVLVPCLFSHHPIFILVTKFHLLLAAVL